MAIESGWRMVMQFFRRKDVATIQLELDATESSERLVKNLNLFDLVCFGIAAIVGAGIFSTIGSAAAAGGPAVVVLFILTAITCLFSALCYAEFAARVPISGSAYTYAYVAFGELVAWIIGWDLLMEYAIGNSVVAFSWSEYLTSFLQGFSVGGWKLDIADWLETDYYSCAQAVKSHSAAAAALDLPQLLAAAKEVQASVAAGMDAQAVNVLPASALLDQARQAGFNPDLLLRQDSLVTVWKNAPIILGLKTIFDAPAMAINLIITYLVYVGIKETKTASNLMVMLKISVVLMVIVVGAFFVKPSNWVPFAPNGMTGVLQGVAAVFFAFIGFDAISTTAEECRQPQRDLPRATVLTLVVCTCLYVAIALVLTGMVSYSKLAVSDPLAFVFEQYNQSWIAGIVSLSALIAIASVFLVFQMGQPRIWMSMARDGLLPKRFASIHPKNKTPAFSTVITGIVVALPLLFLNQEVVTDLCSIGTLFAFMLVSAGVLVMECTNKPDTEVRFRVPYINGAWFLPLIWLGYTYGLFNGLPANHNMFVEPAWEKFPYAAFYLTLTGLSLATARYRWSLIPVLGVLSNLYLIAGLGQHNWERFFIWLAIGMVIYFAYGYWHSRLRNP
jgi:basic amino acid/polyamine antiporter, APA family